MPWDDGLEGVQREIAASSARYIRVLAGPGTGKTFGLQRRVMRLLEEGIEPAQILDVTFTRAASRSLQDDLAALGVSGARHIRARTLHSLAFEVLRCQQTMEATGRVPRPLADFERDPLYADLADQYSDTNYAGVRRKKKAIKAFEAAWATN